MSQELQSVSACFCHIGLLLIYLGYYKMLWSKDGPAPFFEGLLSVHKDDGFSNL